MAKGKRSARGAVGKSEGHPEEVERVTGRARYVDDWAFPEMLYGATVRSSIACGLVLAIERDPGFDWKGFTLVDARDVPGKNVVAMIVDDQPLLADGRVNHREEPLLLIAHPDRGRLSDALEHVRVVYRPEPALLDLDSATEVQKEISINKGNLDEGFAQAELIVEGSYRTGHQAQANIEMRGVIAVPGSPDGITVYGALRGSQVVRGLCTVLDLPASKVKVVQTSFGGECGSGDEQSILAAHASLLARKAGRPVKMIYQRREDLITGSKRHPSIIRHKTGVRRDGTITAIDIDIRIDGGAYVTQSQMVLSRAALHATGPYRVPHVRVRARSMKTHTPPNGAAGEMGAPQSQFAAEMQMDRISRKLAIDPIALRKKNILRPGDLTATGQRLDESASGMVVLERALAITEGWNKELKAESKKGKKKHDKGRKKKLAAKSAQAESGKGPMRGVGLSLSFNGSGAGGGTELHKGSDAYGAFAWSANVAEVEVDPVTWQPRCTRLIAVLDVGQAIDSRRVEAQAAGLIAGSALRAVGWAILEEVVMRGGRMQNGQLTNYTIATTLDAPAITVELTAKSTAKSIDSPQQEEWSGGAEVGEAAGNGPAAAVASAIANAMGISIDELPVTAERIMDKLAGARGVAA